MPVLPVIMSGGAGTRLWPASTDERPKQFHAFGPGGAMLQETAQRVRAEPFLPPLIICNRRHGALVHAQLADIGIEAQDVLLEPFGRNTCAVAIMAAEWAERHTPGAEVLLMPADHVIAADGEFRARVETALPATTDNIVTFGINPTGPESGYGYIQSGEPIFDGVYKVSRFVEKPSRTLAEAYLADGGYSWNGGIFLFRPSVLKEEAMHLCPAVVEASVAALDRSRRTADGLLLDEEAFARCPSVPIDVAVMERTARAAVAPLEVGWADIGSWSELWRLADQDDQGNVHRGDTAHLDAEGSLLWSDGPSISVIGLSDVIVIATAEHVLVLSKDRAQDVKKIVEARKAKT